jgi:hypothetical protein
MSKNTFKRAAITAGLVGAVAFTAVGSAQAAPSQYVRSPQMAVTEDDAQWYQGTIVAFTDNFLELDVNEDIMRFDLTKGADWFGHMRMGATAYVKAKMVDGDYVAVAVIAR